MMTPARNGGAPAAARVVNATKVYGWGDTAVRALDDVTVEVPGGRFTAVMGPSGSGKSMLMHCVAGLDELTSGRAFIGDLELGSLSDRELTLLRREQVGFVFQSYNLVPTLNALENITLPMDLSGVRAEREWLDAVITMVRLAIAWRTGPRSCRAGSSSGSPWPVRWRAGRGSSSRTSPPATSTRGPARRCSRSCAGRCMSWDRRS
jgi:ABC-type ATPase involved in cell division